ncbi:MAG: hypothetical protein LBV80_06530 [Deltaproteobacteria bacterium]|jgi:DNA-binding phage protein|nr:hypothetical protein [Deltaproteobacteria bacterium]
MKINGVVLFDDVAAELFKSDPQLAAETLHDFLADGEIDEFLIALRQVCKAFGGIPAVSRIRRMRAL